MLPVSGIVFQLAEVRRGLQGCGNSDQRIEIEGSVYIE
jgi:hypothetical protein